MTNRSNEAPKATPSPVPAPPSRARRWLSTLATFALLYVVATPPLVYSAARTGLLRGLANDERSPSAVDACIAPARWVYEDSPLKPVLQPWAEFWYDFLLT